MTKELSRALTAPSKEDLAKLKHLLRYIKGTLHFIFLWGPSVSVSSLPCLFDLETFVDSDWAGCVHTRRSTSGGLLVFLGTPIHFYSRTQASVALSSAEAELYSIGSGMAESLHVRDLLLESGFASHINVVVFTDSSAGKSIASRFGASRRIRHIQLRVLFM